MKHTILIIFLVSWTSPNSFSMKPISIKDYFGIWVNDSLYYEMRLSNSPYRSRHFIYNQTSLVINDTSTLHYYDEALSYVTERSSAKGIFLKCIENKEYSIELKILNDSTMTFEEPSTKKNIILKKINYFPCDYFKFGFEDPFLFYTKMKLSIGKMKLVQGRNEKSKFVTFLSTSDVNGFFDFTKYKILIGGSEDLPEMDIIQFFKRDGSSKYYNYTIENDSVNIYQFASNENRAISDTLNFDLKRGNRICILIRMKN